MGQVIMLELARKFSQARAFRLCQFVVRLRREHQTAVLRRRRNGAAEFALCGDEESRRADRPHLRASLRRAVDGAALLHGLWAVGAAGHGGVPVHARDSRGKPISVFNHGEMWRDFTYVDDIVAGILAAVAHRPKKTPPHAVYNLGNHKSEKLTDFIGDLGEGAGAQGASISSSRCSRATSRAPMRTSRLRGAIWGSSPRRRSAKAFRASWPGTKTTTASGQTIRAGVSSGPFLVQILPAEAPVMSRPLARPVAILPAVAAAVAPARVDLRASTRRSVPEPPRVVVVPPVRIVEVAQRDVPAPAVVPAVVVIVRVPVIVGSSDGGRANDVVPHAWPTVTVAVACVTPVAVRSRQIAVVTVAVAIPTISIANDRAKRLVRLGVRAGFPSSSRGRRVGRADCRRGRDGASDSRRRDVAAVRRSAGAALRTGRVFPVRAATAARAGRIVVAVAMAPTVPSPRSAWRSGERTRTTLWSGRILPIRASAAARARRIAVVVAMAPAVRRRRLPALP